jgi:O-antigen/teichoic acid export membrane protein
VNTFFRKNFLIGLSEILCRLPLVFTVGYLARSVGTEIFGNWALILAFQVFIASVAGLGLSSSLSRFVPATPVGEAPAYLRYAFVLCLGPLLMAAVLAFALKGPIGRLLAVKPEFDWLLPIAVLMAAGSVADGFLDAFFKARMAVGRQILFIAARTLIEVVAVVLVFVVTLPSLDEAPLRLAAYVVAVVVGKLALYPGLLAGMTKGISLPPTDRRREFLKYGLPMVPTVLALWLVSQSDRLVLSHFVAKSDLGVYAFGASLASYVVFLSYAVYPLLLPGASKLYDAGHVTSVHTLFLNAQQLFMLLWTGGMTCLALWSGNIIAWTGGSAFAGAGQVLLVLSFAVGLEQLMGIYQYAFHLVKRTDIILWLNLGYAAIITGSLALAGFTSGIALAPWAVLAATLIFNVVRYRIALRYVFLPMPGALVIQIVALGVLTVLLASYAADRNALLRLAVTIVVAVSLAGFTQRRMIAAATVRSRSLDEPTRGAE